MLYLKLKKRCYFPLEMYGMYFASSILVVAAILLVCDQYSLEWLRYFDDLASNTTVYI